MGDTQAILERLERIEALLLRSVSSAAVTDSLLTVEQFAEACGRGRLWVYRRIRSRQIVPARLGKPYRIPSEQVAKFRRCKGGLA